MEDSELFDLATHWAEQAQAQASIAADSARAVKAALRRLAQREAKGGESDYKAALEKIRKRINALSPYMHAGEMHLAMCEINDMLRDVL